MNNKRLLLISGTPASGKDTITDALIMLNPKFIHFKKHKISTGGQLDNSYHHVTKDEFDVMANNGDFVQYHYRYDGGYAVAQYVLEDNWREGKVPIIHVGKYENISPFYNNKYFSIISILLLVSRKETENRLKERNYNDDAEINVRLSAYDEEREELSNLISYGTKLKFDLVIENTNGSAEKTATLLYKFIVNRPEFAGDSIS